MELLLTIQTYAAHSHVNPLTAMDLNGETACTFIASILGVTFYLKTKPKNVDYIFLLNFFLLDYDPVAKSWVVVVVF